MAWLILGRPKVFGTNTVLEYEGSYELVCADGSALCELLCSRVEVAVWSVERAKDGEGEWLG
jgi:hypothetical protein